MSPPCVLIRVKKVSRIEKIARTKRAASEATRPCQLNVNRNRPMTAKITNGKKPRVSSRPAGTASTAGGSRGKVRKSERTITTAIGNTKPAGATAKAALGETTGKNIHLFPLEQLRNPVMRCPTRERTRTEQGKMDSDRQTTKPRTIRTASDSKNLR